MPWEIVGQNEAHPSKGSWSVVPENGGRMASPSDELTITIGDEGLSKTLSEAQKRAEAIAKKESGGNYAAIGKPVNNDRAFGKYQIMGKNIGPWSKEILGREISQQEFMANPKLQDAIAQGKIKQHIAKGYSPEDSAYIWISGRPKAGNKSVDKVSGISAEKYANDVMNNYKGTQGLKGIGEDILEGVKRVPGDIVETVKQLPGELYGAGKQIITDPMRLLKNIAYGAEQGGSAIGNFPATVGDYLASKGIVSPDNIYSKSRAGKDITPETFGLKGDEAGDQFIRSLIGYAPFGVAGELGSLSGLKRLGARSAASGEYGASQGQNPVEAALMSPVIEGAARIPTLPVKTYEKLRPSSLFRGTASPEELVENARAASGTSTPLSGITKSPTTMYTENILEKIPGSGFNKKLAETKEKIQSAGEDLLRDIEPRVYGQDAQSSFKETLQNYSEEAQKQKQEHWNDVSKIAKKEGVDVDLPNFIKLISNKSKEIEASPLYRSDEDFSKLYNKLKKRESSLKNEASSKTLSSILSEHGVPFEKEVKSKRVSPSIKEAKITAAKLNEEGNRILNSKFSSTSDRAQGHFYNKMASEIRKDVQNSVEKKGSKELVDKFNEANRYHAEKFSPFVEDEVRNLLNDPKNADVFAEKIISGSGDNTYMIDKIQDILPEKDKNMLGASLLNKAREIGGDLDTGKMAQIIKKLGPKRFEALFPDKGMRDSILDYIRLRDINSSALNFTANPKTGVQNLLTMLAAAGGGALLGGPIGAAKVGGTIGGANLLSRYLTNPKTREKLVNKMVKNDLKKDKTKYSDIFANAISKPTMAYSQNRNYE